MIEIDKKPEKRKPSKEDLAAMYADYARGRKIKEIAAKFGWSYRAVSNYRHRYDWDERKRKALELARQKELTTQSDIMEDNLSTANFMINSLIKHVEDFMQTSEMTPRTIKEIASTVESMTKSIERIVKTQAFIRNGGAELQKIHKVEEKLDWNDFINTSLKLKKEHGDNFDDKKFVKDVIDAQFKEKK